MHTLHHARLAAAGICFNGSVKAWIEHVDEAPGLRRQVLLDVQPHTALPRHRAESIDHVVDHRLERGVAIQFTRTGAETARRW